MAKKNKQDDAPTVTDVPQYIGPKEISNTIWCGDSAKVLERFGPSCIDFFLVSPPYDDARGNKDYKELFNFKKIANEMTRCLKDGGLIAWNVQDMTNKKTGGKTGTSFEQALYFMGLPGIILHDHIIFRKNSFTFPGTGGRFHSVWENVFIFSKGRPSNLPLLYDRPNISKRSGGPSGRNKDGTRKDYHVAKVHKKMGLRHNVWDYVCGGGHNTKDQVDFPAIMHEKLAEDLILAYSKKGDLVVDCFGGAGTTAVMAHKNKRKFALIEISQAHCELAAKRLKDRFNESVQVRDG